MTIGRERAGWHPGPEPKRDGEVLVLTSSYPLPGQMVPAGYVHEMAVRLARGWRVRVLAPGGPGLPNRERRDGVEIERFTYLWPRRWQVLAYGAGIPDNLGRNRLAALSVPSFLGHWVESAVRRARGARVIQAHWAVPGGLVGAIASARTGVPLVLVLHSGGVHALSRLAGGRPLARWIARRSRSIIATSEDVGRRFRDLLGPDPDDLADRIRFVPLGVDVPDEVGSVGTRSTAPARIVFCGRLVPVKGVDRLLRALARRRDVVVEIAGDGPERARLERLSAELDVRARFWGWIGPHQRSELLRDARCCALPSGITSGGRTEGMPRALLEGLAMGTPVVASAVGDMASPPGRAWVAVPPDDHDALTRALGRVVDDPVHAHELACRGRRFAIDRDWRRLGPAHRAVLEEAMA